MDGSKFIRRYAVDLLVRAEAYEDVTEAIAAEKRTNRWRLSWKIQLIENPGWEDRSGQIQ